MLAGFADTRHAATSPHTRTRLYVAVVNGPCIADVSVLRRVRVHPRLSQQSDLDELRDVR